MPEDDPQGAIAPAEPPRKAAERIRDTARDLFYREGIRAVGVDEIVARAGVTKPSLYRAFGSKDELAAACLRDFEEGFWARFDAAGAAHPGDPRAQILAYFAGLARRASVPGYRGCGLTNAAIEYPLAGHPARVVAEANKREVRLRFMALATEMGASDPEALGDGLFLLFEGANATVQLFGPEGPTRSIVAAADRLIEASLAEPVATPA